MNRELVNEATKPSRKSDKCERQMEGMIQFIRWSDWMEPSIRESNGDLNEYFNGFTVRMDVLGIKKPHSITAEHGFCFK